MNFKKWLCVAASLAMAASIFTGCRDSEESSTSTDVSLYGLNLIHPAEEYFYFLQFQS